MNLNLGGSSHSSGGGGAQPSRELEAIASKFQQRSSELVQEQELLEHDKQERDRELELENQIRERALQTRMEFLIASRHCQGVELEVHRCNQAKEECIKQMEQDAQEAELLNIEAAELEDAWQERMETLIAPHRVKRLVNKRHLQSRIQAYQEGRQKRDKKVKLLQDKRDEKLEQEPWTRQQHRQVLADIQALRDEEDQGNELVHQLAAEVRTRLAKRAELRSTLRKEQQALEEANAERFQLRRGDE